MLSLQRVETNPILTPTHNPWENMLVFNPAAFWRDGEITLLYRAMGKHDPCSRFGIATSTDGIHFQRDSVPVFGGSGHQYESLGAEDPRVAQIGDTYYITYTAVSEDLKAEITEHWQGGIIRKPYIALATTKDFLSFIDYDVIIPEFRGKDASLFPRKIKDEYGLLFRAEEGETLFATSNSLDYWPKRTHVFDKRPGSWDNNRVGIGAPPIETEKGWLLFYHGVDNNHIYRLGIMFLDRDNPAKVLYRSPFPVLEPEKDYEKFGYVPHAIFSCGVIEKDDHYFIYYGACDEVICLATIEKQKVLSLF